MKRRIWFNRRPIKVHPFGDVFGVVVCEWCGAVVAQEFESRHADYHRRESNSGSPHAS